MHGFYLLAFCVAKSVQGHLRTPGTMDYFLGVSHEICAYNGHVHVFFL